MMTEDRGLFYLIKRVKAPRLKKPPHVRLSVGRY